LEEGIGVYAHVFLALSHAYEKLVYPNPPRVVGTASTAQVGEQRIGVYTGSRDEVDVRGRGDPEWRGNVG
jgi:hypothetical protein